MLRARTLSARNGWVGKLGDTRCSAFHCSQVSLVLVNIAIAQIHTSPARPISWGGPPNESVMNIKLNKYAPDGLGNSRVSCEAGTWEVSSSVMSVDSQ